MPIMITNDCPCCRNAINSKEAYETHHCEDCWNKYHNGLRDKDWLNKEDYLKQNKKGLQNDLAMQKKKAW